MAPIVDTSFWKAQSKIPKEFTWPKSDLESADESLMEPVVDLEGFFKGDEVATQEAASRIRSACMNHGFFQVINHGVDSSLIKAAYDHLDPLFRLPTSQKLKAQKLPGSTLGYAVAHSDRFSSKLPWKETLSYGFDYNSSDPIVVDYFKSTFGNDFEQTGVTYQKYCEEMKGLSLAIMELLAISLGVDRFHYKKFFEDGTAIMRLNNYPSCQEPDLTLGTGPHHDPTSLTILHQDDVGGLEVFSGNKWKTVGPRGDALVINIGETFSALSNGIYKSCLHRAVVHRGKDRRSVVFFLNSKGDKVVRPPPELLSSPEGTSRLYPDFTWSDLLHFTQHNYRADGATLHNFVNSLLSSKSADDV